MQPPPINYASVRPDAMSLHCEVNGDSVMITRGRPPPKNELVLEAVAPPITLALFAFLGAGLCSLVWHRWGAVAPVKCYVVILLTAIAVVSTVVYFAWDAWQNGGIVTTIEIRDGVIEWSKLNLWGARTVRWPLEQITDVTVMRLPGGTGSLRVHRRRGVPLNAFAKHTQAELSWVANVIRQTLPVPANPAAGRDEEPVQPAAR
jgi:hypothetical protein